MSKYSSLLTSDLTVTQLGSTKKSGNLLRVRKWWFRLTLVDDGTRVVHEIEVDQGYLANFIMKLP